MKLSKELHQNLSFLILDSISVDYRFIRYIEKNDPSIQLSVCFERENRFIRRGIDESRVQVNRRNDVPETISPPSPNFLVHPELFSRSPPSPMGYHRMVFSWLAENGTEGNIYNRKRRDVTDPSRIPRPVNAPCEFSLPSNGIKRGSKGEVRRNTIPSIGVSSRVPIISSLTNDLRRLTSWAVVLFCFILFYFSGREREDLYASVYQENICRDKRKVLPFCSRDK